MMSMTNGFLIWWLRGPRYRWSRLRRSLFESRYLKVTLPEVNSLEDIEACLRQITWTGDGLLHLYDSISYPQTVWAKRKDDCDGFAVLAAELLRRWNANTRPLLLTAIVEPVQLSHTVCIFYHDGALHFFDNGNLRRGDFQKYGDVVAQFTQATKRLICWDAVQPDTLETVEFHVI
jgi:hypothetical protein